MGTFSRMDFNEFILANNVVSFLDKPIRLSSGRYSRWYVNWRVVAQDVYLLDRLVNFVIDFVEGLGVEPDCFYGVPEGATKVAVITQFKWSRSRRDFSAGRYVLPMGRGSPKKHGMVEDRFFLGRPRGRVVVIEDVTTTGCSIVASIDLINSLGGANVVAAVSLTNRCELRDDGMSVAEAVSRVGVRYYPMSRAVELMRLLALKGKIPIAVRDDIERYFSRYGEEEVKF